MLRSSRILVLLAAGLVLASCGRRVPPPANGPGAIAAAPAVERFLQLAAAKEYVQMGWVFGTAEGPVIKLYPLPEVEKRMYALAHVLQHDSYEIGAESAVPGRIGSAVRFNVQIVRNGRRYQVPFVAVRGPGGRWFVEQMDVEAITNTQ